MLMRNLLILAIVFVGSHFSAALAAEAEFVSAEVKIDIPVHLKKGNIVFNMDHLAFSGDQPVGLKYMALLKERFEREKISGKIIAVFHGDAGYMTLEDESYNAYRNVKTGNPYKAQIQELIKNGVQIEECAMTMKAKKWLNKDLILGVKVNTGAVVRLLELNQQGFYEVHP